MHHVTIGAGHSAVATYSILHSRGLNVSLSSQDGPIAQLHLNHTDEPVPDEGDGPQTIAFYNNDDKDVLSIEVTDADTGEAVPFACEHWVGKRVRVLTFGEGREQFAVALMYFRMPADQEPR
jgi:hypothetical protein